MAAAALAGRRLLLQRCAAGGRCRLLGTAAEASSSPGGSEEAGGAAGGDEIYLKKPAAAVTTRDETSVAMPMSFMTGSVVGKRFYREATVRRADDGNGWTVMLDYRTLKSPAKRPLKLQSRTLAMAIAAEWEYQESDGIRPFTMPLMKLACTALERVPLTRKRIIDNLMKKFHQDLVFCRSPADNELTVGVHQRQQEKIDPILDWVNTEFGFKPVVYTSFFGGHQDEGLAKAVETVLKNTTDFELASIDAMAAAAHSLVIPLAIFRGRLGIEQAIELIRLEEDHQVDRWGLVEGGHDVDIADLKVQMSSAAVFLLLSWQL
ncbi:ATP synthase mitochondrial F1 complex assembly factor 2 [Oryza brachyantha]|uniref:ATP synthase mitochondrial F1 complex assembly factor 2 n=1 Tax=Oryza brachyantha TaxID=4533 RepID=J3MNI4_ORYBR|nr:ATP synthase mitochondrial F1 complex assembly factor 2 [Oryza brachyantha]